MHKGELKFTCTRRRTCRSIGFVDDRQRIHGDLYPEELFRATFLPSSRRDSHEYENGGTRYREGVWPMGEAHLETRYSKIHTGNIHMYGILSFSLLAGNAWEKRVHFSFFCKKKRQFVSLRRNGILIIGTQGRGGKNLHFSKISHLPPPFFLSIPFSGFFFSFSFF